jgi:Ca2+/Na+ antiporter
MAEKCQILAHGFCDSPNHYINVFRVYYCFLNGNNTIYITFSVTMVIFLFSLIGHIRRAYFTRPLMKLRRLLGIKSILAEMVTIPLASGIGPLLVRLQAATHNLDFQFNLAATLGAMFAMNAFGIGISAFALGFSKRVDLTQLGISLGASFLALMLMFLICEQKTITTMHGFVFIFIWVFYLFVIGVRVKEDKRKGIF